jgi:hypothetical protein
VAAPHAVEGLVEPAESYNQGVARVVFSPRRDLSKPLVEIDPNAGRVEKAGLWAFRAYLGFVAASAIAVGFLCVLLFLVVIILFG